MTTLKRTVLPLFCFTALLTLGASADDGFRTRPLSFEAPPITYPAAQYSLDSMANHPYNSATAPGHASQSPGSPKWFVPGYGYQRPYGYGSTLNRRLRNPYLTEYSFGTRRPNLRRNDTTHLYWTNAYGGPWYLPGSTTNTRPRTFAW